MEHFLRFKAERYGQSPKRLTAEAMRALTEYPWPGNVRELENAVEYALVIYSNDLKQLLQAHMSDSVPLAEIEKRYILSVLQQFDGNQVRAAAAQGIDRSKLYRRLKEYGVWR